MRRNTNQESVKVRVNRWFLQSPKLAKIISNAGYFIKHPTKLNEKLNEIYNSATSSAEKQTLIEFGAKIQALYRMIKMSLNGEYRGIPKGQLIFGLTGFLYLISPVDVVPDFVPFIGFIDDAAFMLWLLGKAASEIEKFEDWEKSQGKIPLNPIF